MTIQRKDGLKKGDVVVTTRDQNARFGETRLGKKKGVRLKEGTVGTIEFFRGDYVTILGSSGGYFRVTAYALREWVRPPQITHPTMRTPASPIAEHETGEYTATASRLTMASLRGRLRASVVVNENITLSPYEASLCFIALDELVNPERNNL
jgi:hypothetical protein